MPGSEALELDDVMPKVFLISPFGQPFDEQYENLIKPVIEGLGHTVTRADDIYGARPIVDDIFEQISGADVVLADVTGKNPNVNYELGVAHALQRPTIIITRNIEDAPFDYKHIRIITYDPVARGWRRTFADNLRETLAIVIAAKSGAYQASILEKYQISAQSKRLGGLLNVFESRQGMNLFLDGSWNSAVRQIDVMAFGLKSFRDAKTLDVKRELRNGLRLRVLSPRPRSAFLKQREREEGLNVDSISRTIDELVEWIREMDRSSNGVGSASIRLYEGLPQNFYWRQDGDVFVGPYLRGIGSQQTITYHFDSSSRCGNFFVEHFESIWGRTPS